VVRCIPDAGKTQQTRSSPPLTGPLRLLILTVGMPQLTSASVVLASLVAISLNGCKSGGDPTSPADGGPEAAAASEAGASGDEAAETAGSSLSHCPLPPDVKGAALALVRWQDGIAFCIDANEVTNQDYATFLAAGVAVSTQSSRCGWNQTFVPEAKSTNGPACPTFDPAGRADYPVVCVDWCDADAYCRWAGKHLCQKPGGEVVTGALTAKDASEWVIACTGDAKSKYPYGDTASPGRCVDKTYAAATPGLRPVKDATMCEGGVPGLFDMSGNAWEWLDDCEQQSSTGSDDSCPPVGGSFSSELTGSTCTDSTGFFRKQVAGDTGFRCCVGADFF